MENYLIEHVDNSDILGEGFGIFIKYHCQKCGSVNLIANTRVLHPKARPGLIPVVPFDTKVERLICRSCHYTTKYESE